MKVGVEGGVASIFFYGTSWKQFEGVFRLYSNCRGQQVEKPCFVLP